MLCCAWTPFRLFMWLVDLQSSLTEAMLQLCLLPCTFPAPPKYGVLPAEAQLFLNSLSCNKCLQRSCGSIVHTIERSRACLSYHVHRLVTTGPGLPMQTLGLMCIFLLYFSSGTRIRPLSCPGLCAAGRMACAVWKARLLSSEQP